MQQTNLLQPEKKILIQLRKHKFNKQVLFPKFFL